MKKALFGVLLFFAASAASAQESPLKVTLYFPHWTDGKGWRNVFQFTNLHEDLGGEATLRFYNDLGNEAHVETDLGVTPVRFELMPTGAVTVKTLGHGALDGSTQGMAVVESKVRVGGKIRYHYPAFHIQTAVSPSPTRLGFTVFADFARNPMQNSGIALANPNDESSYIDLKLVGENGDEVVRKRMTLEARGHIAGLLDWPEFFQEYFSVQDEFHGTIAIVAERPIAVLALGVAGREDGSFLMDNGSPLPPRYPDFAEMRRHSVQAVYFVPADMTPDPDYISGTRFTAKKVLDWYDIELQRAGQGDLSSVLDFVREDGGKINVGLVRGRENQEVYADLYGYGPTKLDSELRAIYPNQDKMLVLVQTSGMGFAYGGAGRYAVVAVGVGMSSFPEYTFGNFSEGYLRSGDDMVRWKIASTVKTAAHEVGHVLGLPHSSSLEEYFQGKFGNLMCNPCRFGSEMNLGFFAGSLIPDISPDNEPFVYPALDEVEIETLVQRR